jgi:hypothetical protein
MRKIEKIEDIYPLTIVKTRFGKIVICNFEVDAGESDEALEMSLINYIQGVEEVQYRLSEWMEEHVAPCLYGIGNTIQDAFENYKKKCCILMQHNKQLKLEL